MDIKAIVAKLRKGESLTTEEQAFADSYDPEKASADKAAAARRDAEKKLRDKEAELKRLQDEIEEERQAAEEKANGSKPEIEKLQAQIAKLTKADADRQAAYAKLEAEKRALLRGGKLDKILGGLKFVDGVDVSLPRLALERALADMKDEDLDSEDLVKPIIETFRSKNKALILDESPGGAGTPPKDRPAGSPGSKPVDKMTAEEREADLKKQGIV